MSEITKSAIVPFSSQQMLDLVNDVPAYPKFLKWCKKGYIDQQFAEGYSAGMVINIKGIQIEFKTENSIIETADSKQLTMKLISGPFKQLAGEWRFNQYPELGSKVSLHLKYEIKSQLLGRMFAKGFDQIASQMVSDFVQRAGVVYAEG